MKDIFLSYSSQDRERLVPLVDSLEAQGWSVFWDHRAIKVAEDWHKVIGTAIQQCRCVIVVWSKHSVNSAWVMEEALIAKSRGVLYPIFIDPVPIPFGFTLIQAADFTAWDGDTSHQEFRRLKEQLSIRLNVQPEPNPPLIPEPEPEPEKVTSTLQSGPAETSVTSGTHVGDSSKAKLLGGLAALAIAGFGGYQLIGGDTKWSESAISEAFANGKLPKMVLIPAGSFMMGCRDDKESNCQDDEKPAHKVNIKQFYLAETEVTVGHYLTCVEDGGCDEPSWRESGSEYNLKTGTDDYYKKMGDALTNESSPIVDVSWNDAQKYVQWLSKKTGNKYRLPSEAEWEYAARAGTETNYSWGKDIGSNNANCLSGCGDSFEFLSPVASFSANKFGLFDMHGNVWEWVEDKWHRNYNGAPSGGSAWVSGSGSNRVLRGGSWSYAPRYLRSADRIFNAPDNRYDNIGFRPAQDYGQ